MEDNIIKLRDGTIAVFNGGNALDGCPKSYDEADQIELTLNSGESKEDWEGMSPRWSFDCGYKLDYDGPLISVSSRFYPPKTHYGPTWDGTVSIYFLDKTVSEKKFDCKTLDELKTQVDNYIENVKDSLEKKILLINQKP